MTEIDFWHADEDLRNLRIVCKFKVECISKWSQSIRLLGS